MLEVVVTKTNSKMGRILKLGRKDYNDDEYSTFQISERSGMFL